MRPAGPTGVVDARQAQGTRWVTAHPCIQRLTRCNTTLQENATTKKRMAREDASSVLAEMMALRDQHMKLKVKFDAVQRQNEALWKVRQRIESFN